MWLRGASIQERRGTVIGVSKVVSKSVLNDRLHAAQSIDSAVIATKSNATLSATGKHS